MTCIVLFTHDAFGSGHMRRNLVIIQAISRVDPEVSVLLVTWSPLVKMQEQLPSNSDYLILPSSITPREEGNGPAALDIGATEVAAIWGGVVDRLLLDFGASISLVNNLPLGTRFGLMRALKTCYQYKIQRHWACGTFLTRQKKV